MDSISGEITTENDGFSEQHKLFTYSEEERQENQINKSNASLVFTPEFIPFYPDIKKKYKLTHTETLIYGFIRFYKSHNNARFYFTNEQLAKIIGMSTSTAEKSVSALINKDLIKVSYRIKAGGGKSRFINQIRTSENYYSEPPKIESRNLQKLMDNKNKINKNKINKAFFKKNPIIQDEDYLKWRHLKLSKGDYYIIQALGNKLDSRYPKFKYSAEWEEALDLIRKE